MRIWHCIFPEDSSPGGIWQVSRDLLELFTKSEKIDCKPLVFSHEILRLSRGKEPATKLVRLGSIIRDVFSKRKRSAVNIFKLPYNLREKVIRELFLYDDFSDKQHLMNTEWLSTDLAWEGLYDPSRTVLNTDLNYPCDFLFVPQIFFPIKNDKTTSYVVRYYDSVFITHPETIPSFAIDVYLKRLKACVDHPRVYFVCISQPVMDELIELFPKVKDRVFMVPIHFKEPPSDLVHKEEHRVYQLDRFALSVGNLIPRKNHETTLAGWRLFCQQNKEQALPLVLVGNKGHLNDQLLANMQPDIDAGTLIVLDNVSKKMLWQLYRKASVFITSSIHEGFSMPPVEAQFSDCLVIASDIAIHRWVLGEGALFFSQDDSKALCSCMEQILAHSPNNTHLIRCAQKNVKRFSQERVMPLWEELVVTIAQQKAMR